MWRFQEKFVQSCRTRHLGISRLMLDGVKKAHGIIQSGKTIGNVALEDLEAVNICGVTICVIVCIMRLQYAIYSTLRVCS